MGGSISRPLPYKDGRLVYTSGSRSLVGNRGYTGPALRGGSFTPPAPGLFRSATVYQPLPYKKGAPCTPLAPGVSRSADVRVHPSTL